MTPMKPPRRWKLKLTVTLVLGAIGFFAYWWLDGGRYMFFPKNWGVVEEGVIYRSGQIHPRIIEDVLRENEIDVIIDLAIDTPGREDHEAEVAAAKKLDIPKIDFVSLDGSGRGDIADYEGALAEILAAKRAGKRVLVHCAAGSERTGGVIACYRMLFQGWDGKRAYEEYLSYRRRPPDHTRLTDFVNANMEALVDGLVKRGLLPAGPDPLPRFGP